MTLIDSLDTIPPRTEWGYTVATGKRVELYIGPGLARVLADHPQKLSTVANAVADRYAEMIAQNVDLVPDEAALRKVKTLLPTDRMVSAQELHGLPAIASAKFGRDDPLAVELNSLDYLGVLVIVDAAERLS